MLLADRMALSGAEAGVPAPLLTILEIGLCVAVVLSYY